MPKRRIKVYQDAQKKEETLREYVQKMSKERGKRYVRKVAKVWANVCTERNKIKAKSTQGK